MNMHIPNRRRRVALAKALIKSAGSLLVLATPRHTHLSKHNAQQALRGDFARIGADMKVATKKEREREEAGR